jgi:hypothetical protein
MSLSNQKDFQVFKKKKVFKKVLKSKKVLKKLDF